MLGTFNNYCFKLSGFCSALNMNQGHWFSYDVSHFSVILVLFEKQWRHFFKGLQCKDSMHASPDDKTFHDTLSLYPMDTTHTDTHTSIHTYTYYTHTFIHTYTYYTHCVTRMYLLISVTLSSLSAYLIAGLLVDLHITVCLSVYVCIVTCITINCPCIYLMSMF